MYFSISRSSLDSLFAALLAANFFLQQCITAKRPTKMTAKNAAAPTAKPILAKPTLASWDWSQLRKFMSFLSPGGISSVGWTTWLETSPAGDSTDGGRLAAVGVGLATGLEIKVDCTGRGGLTRLLSWEGVGSTAGLGTSPDRTQE